MTKTPKKTAPASITESSGNVFADLGLPNPEQALVKAELTLQIYRIIKQRGMTQAKPPKTRHQAASRLLAHAQPSGEFFSGASHGIPHRARPGRGDRRPALAQGARRNVRDDWIGPLPTLEIVTDGPICFTLERELLFPDALSLEIGSVSAETPTPHASKS